MRIALTGTPGTGKTSASEGLRRLGRPVIELNEFARDHGLLGKKDRRRGSREVDTDLLGRALDEAGLPDGAILVGHLSHFLDVDLIVVLRCRPSILRERLASRGYPVSKIDENVEAEALDVVLVEALETGRTVLEVDTTGLTVEECVQALLEILDGKREKYEAGHIDWSEEVLGWF